ncbi:MAG TPA: hypothetical protein PLW35_13265 [Verrucomicrobiota bacterium]|nr:hypothetical protein [Verrucomicrobiota bacterium]
MKTRNTCGESYLLAELTNSNNSRFLAVARRGRFVIFDIGFCAA